MASASPSSRNRRFARRHSCLGRCRSDCRPGGSRWSCSGRSRAEAEAASRRTTHWPYPAPRIRCRRPPLSRHGDGRTAHWRAGQRRLSRSSLDLPATTTSRSRRSGLSTAGCADGGGSVRNPSMSECPALCRNRAGLVAAGRVEGVQLLVHERAGGSRSTKVAELRLDATGAWTLAGGGRGARLLGSYSPLCVVVDGGGDVMDDPRVPSLVRLQVCGQRMAVWALLSGCVVLLGLFHGAGPPRRNRIRLFGHPTPQWHDSDPLVHYPGSQQRDRAWRHPGG